MMIPNDEDQVKTFKFPKWILKTIILTLASILIISNYFIYSFINVKEKYAEKSRNIETLEIINDQQKKQINELLTYAQGISEKIDHLNELEVEVKDLVGLSTDKKEEDDEKEKKVEKVSTTRGGFFRNKKDPLQEYDQSTALLKIEKDLNAIDESLSQEENTFHTLKRDVATQLDYLTAQPTGWPNNGRISSPFGKRKAPKRGASTFHKGIDIANTYGTPIKAAANGQVISAGWKGGLGYTVIISHGYGFTTVYGHNSSIQVKVGQQVKKGHIIAKLGNSGNSTGPHVHYDIHVNGTPVSSMKYLGK